MPFSTFFSYFLYEAQFNLVKAISLHQSILVYMVNLILYLVQAAIETLTIDVQSRNG